VAAATGGRRVGHHRTDQRRTNQRRGGGARSSVDLDDPDLALHLHLGGGEASLSLDGSGGSLHRRGYRAAMGLAPLKENLAAGLVALTGWDGTVPLADPLCGSGTLLIEAARLALGLAPVAPSAATKCGTHSNRPPSPPMWSGCR
jgi:23S rRNA G2445 N2-methylase RlmL